MPAMSRGPVAKVRPVKKAKGGTPSSRKHHFESFSQRVAKLKIEPVRRGRSTIIDDAELDTSFSYFKNALDEWKDLNISESFTAFARKVRPLCESLPQILHHDDRIVELLVQFIEKGDVHSEEPLLSLMGHFAHDLGARFEKHFEVVVKTVAQVAAKHPDVAVIEWSFTCLAWLFKYLSRLLAPDLRPVFDLMSPLLGREHQKAFVTRFAAESLSFLVRKAGAVYHRDKAPLALIMKHISDQLGALQGSGKDSEFQQGIMSLLADSMKGVQRGLHSSAAAIMQELLKQTYSEEHVALVHAPLESVLLGVTISLIHHSEAETFAPLVEIILEQAKAKSSDARFSGLSSRLLYTICGVRKGSRIASWSPVFDALSPLVRTVDQSSKIEASEKQDILSASAVIFHYCSLDAAIPNVHLLERFSKSPWENQFLSFCNLFADIGSERFQSLLLPYFKRYVIQKSAEHGDELCLVLGELCRRDVLAPGSLQPSSQWYTSIVRQFASLSNANANVQDLESEAARCNAFLGASQALKVPEETLNSISSHLISAVKHASDDREPGLPSPVDIFSVGNGLKFLLRQDRLQDELTGLWTSLCRSAGVYGHLVPFWEVLLSVAERTRTKLEVEGPYKESFQKTLIRCLSSPSHQLRLSALGIIELIVQKDEKLKNAIGTALLIEETPLNLENARSISMRIRQLAKGYGEVCSDEWVGEAIPSFCLGLLHVRLAQVWDDACSALKDMSETKDGEAHISRIALEWIEGSAELESTVPAANEAAPTPRRYASEFECTNLMQLEDKIQSRQSITEDLDQQLRAQFNSQHPRSALITPFSRTQALRLLNIIPQIAEKRSRHLVPVLLKWVSKQTDADDVDMEEEEEVEQLESVTNRWARKDQKALLSVFSKFVNPKVLFKSDEVYEALLSLLSNGDAEIQKAALNAILTWKNVAITRYSENLFNLLDDARFREEISVFMDVGKEESELQEEHREQLLPVILRLLYGKVISGKRGQEAKRKAVFIALTRFEADAIQQFLAIAMGPLRGLSILKEDGSVDEELFRKDLMTWRKQVGLLNMLEDMLTTLKTTLTPFTSLIVDPLLYCLVKASRGLLKADAPVDSGDEVDQSTQLSLLKTIRQRGFRSLYHLFDSCPDFAWKRYMSTIVAELVSTRLDHFPIETAQSISGLLQLFATWSKHLATASFLVEFNPEILTKTIDCLEVPSAKDEVKIFILDQVFRSLISTAEDESDEWTLDQQRQRNGIRSNILQPFSNAILVRVGDLLRKNPSKNLLDSAVLTVSQLARHAKGSAEYRSMIEIATFLLRQPTKRVNPQTKLNLLSILVIFIHMCDNKDLEDLFEGVFDATSSQFSFFRDRRTRTVLCDVIQELSYHNKELSTVSDLCRDLNSYSRSRLDEPDFDRRSKAFTTINQEKGQTFSLMQWKPLVFNMLYYIKDNEELSIRVNASLSLRRFTDKSLQDESFKEFISSTLLPAIQNGVREPSELVRAEFLAVLAHLVKVYPEWPVVSDMLVLLGPDDESSFFGNILHIQGHRRLRALRRLESNASALQAGNVSHIIIPLIEQFIFDKAEDEHAHNLAGEAIRAIGTLSEHLEWPQFRSLLRRYIGYLSSKEDAQKTIIKLLAGMMDSLNRAGQLRNAHVSKSTEEDDVDEDEEEDDAMVIDKPASTLTKTLPQQEKLTSDLTGNILPPLTDFLHNKDETTVSLRVPVAVAVTKILLLLPQHEVEARLPSVLLDICHILKSRSQDGRDMSRTTLAEIATLTGPNYLSFILKSLRTALQRGYQLHVLSFTLHYILVQMAPDLKAGDFDYCLPELMDVIMDDIFGVTGQEKDAEEYISKMKEVKSSKSFDSMDLISRTVTPNHLVELVLPIRSLLQERLTTKMVSKINELLRRIGLGVLHNPTVKDRDILIFCFELIQEVYKVNTNPDEGKQEDLKNKRYLINMKGAAKSGARGSASSYLYKLTRFSLDILRTVLRKHEELKTPQNLAGFIPILGDALVQGQEEVQISAVRVLTTIIKVPLPVLDQNAPVYVEEAVQIIQDAPSTNTELAQASLKLISSILTERTSVNIEETHIAGLLKRLLPDLDEPDRQGVTFGFIKAVMSRKIVITEVYEVMDKVAAMMVTNQTRSARDLARSNYFNFLMEYPQGKGRFNKQLEFLLRNLRYDYVEGRQSVMEALNLVLTKVGDDVLQDVLEMMFLPLVHSMANDDSDDCRTMAGALVKKVFERADAQRIKSFTTDIREWLEQDEDPGLKRIGIQCWGLYFEVGEPGTKEITFVLAQLQATTKECLARRDEDDWELIYYSLTVFSKFCKTTPEAAFAANQKDLWATIQSCVAYPHGWVKLTAARLIGMLFSDLATTNGDAGLNALPLKGSKGLKLTEENMIQLTSAFLRNLSIPDVSEDLCTQTVRDLAFLARCLAVNGATWSWQKVGDDEEADDADAEDAHNGTTNGDAASSEEEEFAGFSPPPTPPVKKSSSITTTAIHRLITRLSGIIRRETKIMRLASLYPKTAVMHLLETLVSKLPVQSLNPSLSHLLTTTSILTDPVTSVPRSTEPSFNDTYKNLIDKAREIMAILQKRMGTQEFLDIMSEVQKGVKAKREERRTKRRIEAVTAPEKFAKEKKRRHDVAKARRKEKGREERGRRRGW